MIINELYMYYAKLNLALELTDMCMKCACTAVKPTIKTRKIYSRQG